MGDRDDIAALLRLADRAMAACQNVIDVADGIMPEPRERKPPEHEHFIVHDGQDHVLLIDGAFDGIVHERHRGTWVSDHKGVRIFHDNGQRATFKHPKTGVDHIGIGVDPYQDAGYTEEYPQR